MGAKACNVKEVWAGNLEEEMARIAKLTEHYQYVAMDTEFPGVVARPIGSRSSEYKYNLLSVNVNLLKVIQLGISLSNEAGESPPECAAWQFNFKFDLTEDMYASDSVTLLQEHGTDFASHKRYGIDIQDFGELIMTSGLVLQEGVKWISFHGGFDFAYLLRILTALPLPSRENDFFQLVFLYFPVFYDIKCLMDSTNNLHGGLNAVAQTVGVKRFGQVQQAGSDALLSLHVFFRLYKKIFKGHLPDGKRGVLYGYGVANRGLDAVETDTAA